MQLQLKPVPQLTHKLRLTSQMKLALNLLQMPLVELGDYVKEQAEENPLLEIDAVRDSEENKIANESENKADSLKEIESGLDYNRDEFDEKKRNYRESLITQSTTLSDHLLEQLHLSCNSEEDRKIGEVLIANINEDGYLRSSVEEIAQSAQVIPQEVEKVLSLIQTFDPLGVGARDLRECLLLQIKTKSKENSIAFQIIDKYLPLLEKKKLELIAQKISAGKSATRHGARLPAVGQGLANLCGEHCGKVTVENIKEAVKEIAHCEPKPGRFFNTEKTLHLIPDVILEKNDDTYEVILNEQKLPRLSLNPKYKSMLKQENLPEDTKEYLKERLRAANLLMNAINKRKETIRKVTEAIVQFQKDFLDKGSANLHPMTLAQIAQLVEKHKSTVSRAINNKYLQTPGGIFELRHFFNSGIKQQDGESFSSKAIQSKIKDLIENENQEKPLTDQELVDLLKQENITLSRRTLAKYRQQLKILPSPLRRE